MQRYIDTLPATKRPTDRHSLSHTVNRPRLVVGRHRAGALENTKKVYDLHQRSWVSVTRRGEGYRDRLIVTASIRRAATWPGYLCRPLGLDVERGEGCRLSS